MSVTSRPTDSRRATRSPYPVRRWTVAEYHRLGRAGILTTEDRVELLEGWIVPKVTHYPLHAWTVTRLSELLGPAIGAAWLTRVQCPIETADSEPEPDLVVAERRPDAYISCHPSGDDIGLVIEVADASLRKDRRKGRIYAGAGIPAYWIVNLNDRQIEVHTQPEPKSRQYREVHLLQPTDRVSLLLGGIPSADFAVSDLLPPDKS